MTLTRLSHKTYPRFNYNTQLMEKNPYLWGYLIKEDGMLELPSIGKVKAEGFSLRELETIIQTISLEYFEDPIVTEIVALEKFYPGEDYHQDYYVKNPHQGYCSFVIRPKLEKLGLKF